MKNLYISLYQITDTSRFGELLACLNKNLSLFDRVFILSEAGLEIGKFGVFKSSKIILLPVTVRPTFRHFFHAMQKTAGDQDVNVVANSDIYFENLEFDIQPMQCYALTRYDAYTGVFLNRIDSQDVWVFRGKLPHLNFYCSFLMGIPGCDNRLAWELANIGYTVTNPSLTIRTFHMHKRPTMHDRNNVISPPYFKITPSSL